MTYVLRVTWLVACGLVLWLTLTTYEPNAKESDAAVFFALMMTFLTFPAGLIVMGLVAIGVSMSNAHALLNSDLSFVVFWVLLVCVGYLQWFVFLPKIVKRLRNLWPAGSVRQRH